VDNFFYELSMTEKTFVKQLERIFIQEGFLTKQEVGVGYGVADLVLVKLIPGQCAIRLKNKQLKPLLREDYFKIFRYLPEEESGKRPATLDHLVKRTKLSKSFLKYHILRKLEHDGYIKNVDGGFYFKINGWMPIAEEIIAIEAKLKDWKRGFIQANRYKSFANKVYLALPDDKAHLVDEALLKKHNIGLIAFDPRESEIKKTIHPRTAQPLNTFKYDFAAEFFLNRGVLKKFALL